MLRLWMAPGIYGYLYAGYYSVVDALETGDTCDTRLLLLHSAECCDRRAEEYRLRLQEVRR